MNQIGELFSVACATARVHVKHNVPFGRPHLLDCVEAIPVVGKWTAMNFEDHRIFFGWIKIRRLHDPGLYLALINGRLEPELLNWGWFFLHEKLLVECS